MKWKVGDTTITKIQEIVYPEFDDVIPAATPEVVKQVKWLFPHFVTDDGHLSLSIHSLIVDTPGATLIVDTCIGNDRDRNPFEVMHMLSTILYGRHDRLGLSPRWCGLCAVHASASRPRRLEYADSVDGKWVPTFPTRRTSWAKKELDFWGSIDETATRTTSCSCNAGYSNGFGAAGTRCRSRETGRRSGRGLRGRASHSDTGAHPGALFRSDRIGGRNRDDHRRLHPPPDPV